jgi:hypothetical protein
VIGGCTTPGRLVGPPPRRPGWCDHPRGFSRLLRPPTLIEGGYGSTSRVIATTPEGFGVVAATPASHWGWPMPPLLIFGGGHDHPPWHQGWCDHPKNALWVHHEVLQGRCDHPQFYGWPTTHCFFRVFILFLIF